MDEVKLLPCKVFAERGVQIANDGYHDRADYPPYAPAPWDDRLRWSDYIKRIIGEEFARAIEATRPTDEVVESVKASLEDVFYDTLGCAFDADILARAAIAAMKDAASD